MNINEYFQLARRNLVIILICTLASSAVGSILVNKLNSEALENSLFISISVQDKQPYTSSAFDNLQAADQMTESIQGWLKDPSLQAEISNSTGLNYAIKGKRQEKNNLIINFTSEDSISAEKYSQSIVKILTDRLAQYSKNSNLSFFLNPTPLHSTNSPHRATILLILALLLGALLGYGFSYLYELVLGKVRSIKQFKEITNLASPFHFQSNRHLSKNYQYLVAYLNQNYQDKKVQLLNLSHRSKVGLEIISKHGNFTEIKSYDLPTELEKINKDLPTIIIVELGFTNQNTLENLLKLSFTKLEAIIFDRIKH